MSNLEFLNLPKSPTYQRVYGSHVNKLLLNPKSPYQYKHVDRFKKLDKSRKPAFARSLPLRPVDVFDFAPHPSKDVSLLYEYYFPESAAQHQYPSVAEMSFIQRKLEERDLENQKAQTRGSKDWIEDETNAHAKDEVEASKEDSPHHLPPLTSKSPKMGSTQTTIRTYHDGSTTPLPFVSVAESRENRTLKREWGEMTQGQKNLYSDFVETGGKDWRDDIRDKIWLSTLERIDERVRNNNSSAHVAEVCASARTQQEDRLQKLVAVQQEKEARQKVAQQNRLTPTQVRKLAVIATKEWKKFDFAKKKQLKEKTAAAEQSQSQREEEAERLVAEGEV